MKVPGLDNRAALVFNKHFEIKNLTCLRPNFRGTLHTGRAFPTSLSLGWVMGGEETLMRFHNYEQDFLRKGKGRKRKWKVNSHDKLK